MTNSRHILLMDGPDQRGLIYHVTNILFRQGLNIIRNDEYVSPDGQFFMRTEFESSNPQDLLDGPALLAQLSAGLDPAITLRLNPRKKKNVVLLVTKEHHCLGELLIRYAFDELDADILAVVSNYNHLQPLVSKFGIPFHYISHDHKTREEHEEAILRTLAIYEPEYLVLAKYMRVLTPEFVRHYPNRIINIHHSFLPAFVGASPYRQAYERGVKIIGATAHFVNNDLDEGPIITQDVKEVDHRHTAADMATMGRDVEKLVLSKALKLVFNDRVFIHNNRTVVF
ncbi:formyltetrahydrofolate deformylase [Rudanella paleaurantiibacter]|uniref:Formyltetrahydrofolate deformylase n=1 Tax=Rudanella paleaurantiibacter TaxID=2614655 RepID=A0A7J5TWX8_9BACT|nr:formyltetrahydrofolate deformylase [Rudanella paleaurantiibacter]KAB7729087.1 formyltetrahydrofolate deformylase [Rudanella paleaurantiibacter]